MRTGGAGRTAGASNFAAILRGFFVYALLLLGLAAWMTQHHLDFLNPGQGNYILVAGAAILASFWLGNSPVAYSQTSKFLLRMLRARLNELDLDADAHGVRRPAPDSEDERSAERDSRPETAPAARQRAATA